MVPERETKSVSVEGTYDTDLTDRAADGRAARPAGRAASPSGCAKARLSGRTVTIKVRLHDFTTLTRSTTLAAPTDDARAIARLARGLLADLDTSGGVRLLGVGVSGLADWIQEDLFGETTRTTAEATGSRWPSCRPRPRDRTWAPGHGRRARRARPRLGVGLGPRAW